MKFAICHELYENIDWATQCRLMAEAGYTGIEVAPFTISLDLAVRARSSVFARMREDDASPKRTGGDWTALDAGEDDRSVSDQS
jgi:hypothetical protein